MTTIDDSTAVGLGMLTFLLIVVLYVWTALALSAVFRKSGEQPWKAWVPILNQVVLLQRGRFSAWLFLLVLVPFVGPVIVWALLVAACYRINVAFGHGVGMTVLAALALPVWASILGFGPARWLGTELGARGAQGAGPRRTAAADPDELREYVPRATPPSYSPSLPDPLTQLARPAPPSGDRNPLPAPSPSPAPISAVPGRAASPAPEPAAEPWAPRRSPMAETDAFAGTSEQVSAIVGAPDGSASASRRSEAEPRWDGTPRSARASVSAQHIKPHIPDDPLDETIITRRRRTPWSLVPPAGAAIPLTADVVLVGRRPAADGEFPGAQLVSIDDGTVSKTHARLSLRDDHWYVTDLGSTNGVLFATLMGTEVEAAPGEEVEAGERFFLGDAEIRLQRSDG
jgi:hypothetical protein